MLEIIPKTESQPQVIKKVVWYGAIAFLVAAVGLLVLFMFLKSNAENRIADIDATLRVGKNAQEKALEKTVLGYQQKIQDFTTLLSSRKDAAPFLPLVEARTHPSVFFNTASLDVLEGRMVLKGQATDFRSLGEQIAAFEEAEEVTSMKLSEVSLAKGVVLFTLELQFSQNL